MKLYLSPKASYLYQALKFKSVPYAEQVKALFRDIQAHPQEGIGTPEMIDASLPGYWERRFNGSGMVTYYSEGDYVIIISIMNELLPSYEELPFKLQEASKEDYAQMIRQMEANRGHADDPKVGRELVFPKLPPEFFEKAREETERFVLKGAKLPKEYEGLDASEYPEMDKRLLADALYEKYITRT